MKRPTSTKHSSMPSLLTPGANWILKWTDADPLQLEVHNRRRKEVKFYGTGDRKLLTIFKEYPYSITYDIEEDGENMELLLILDDEYQIFSLHTRL